MKNDNLTFEEIKKIIDTHDAVLTWSLECQMYMFSEHAAAIVITCDKQGEVLSALCRCSGKIKNFENEEQETAQQISDSCQNIPSVKKQIQMLETIKANHHAKKR